MPIIPNAADACAGAADLAALSLLDSENPAPFFFTVPDGLLMGAPVAELILNVMLDLWGKPQHPIEFSTEAVVQFLLVRRRLRTAQRKPAFASGNDRVIIAAHG
ncbi:hypothetical protein [Asticcacaulis sp. 201]|uniref:hypothetical protein n=1 Tax=Asticcacaulis sp. 201 TaxID=3028787 RepID=UPI0029168E15|nr:hypothetical protein [Asticcacaulis sp. 201]MDV6329618.1 hypothetical protein [Asticcacaulis sp. 201]